MTHAIIIFTAVTAAYVAGMTLGMSIITREVTGKINGTSILTNISSSLIMLGWGIAAFVYPIQTRIW